MKILGLSFATWSIEDETKILLIDLPPTDDEGHNIELWYFAPDGIVPEIEYNDNGL